MGLEQRNDQVNDFERRRPVLFAAGAGALIALLVVLAGGSWSWALALGAFVAVMRLVIRPRIVARRSLR